MKKKESRNILSRNSKVGNLTPTLFEVIKVQNHQLQNIDFHNNRLNRSLSDIFGIKDHIDLKKIIKIPGNLDKQIYKCRVIYSNKIEKVQFEPYTQKVIKSLRLVENNEIDYGYKYFDRSKINKLFEQRKNCDDILIVKNGFVTDTSYANIIFWDGSKWITPSTPLLPGTKRQKLIEGKIIIEKKIRVTDLPSFEKARIINAMIDLENRNDIYIFNS